MIRTSQSNILASENIFRKRERHFLLAPTCGALIVLMEFRMNFTIMFNFDQISQFFTIFTMLTKFHNLVSCVLDIMCIYFMGLFYAGLANLRCGTTPPSLMALSNQIYSENQRSAAHVKCKMCNFEAVTEVPTRSTCE